MSESYRIGIVGATGAVGGMLLRVLEERSFPVSDLVAFASERSAGVPVRFRGEPIECVELDEALVDGFDIVFSAAGGSVAQEWAPRFASAGATVIDKSSAFRDTVPLVVAEVNPEALEGHDGVIASPNCSTIQLVLVLKPILDVAGIERLVISTYQSVSGTGVHAVEELQTQSYAELDSKAPPPPSAYPHRIAFNVIPQVESFGDGDDYTTEERKMMNETRRILGAEDIGISATCARVPVFIGHSESVNVQTRDALSPEHCRALLAAAPGINVVDDPPHAGYPLALDAAGIDDVLVGRIRHDASHERCLNMWIVGDNLRKGAATNAVQLAEELVTRHLLPSAQAA
ncbi:MAG: aspartate-semialdehyde dehydrogenase [Thermoleophilaceae bacterium]